MSATLYCGDVREVLARLPERSVQCCLTSPPYFGLRDYGVAGQLGLERTPDEYVAAMVGVFRAVRRVLRDDGVLWLNLGDSYCSTDKWGGGKSGNNGKHTVDKDGGVPSWAVRAKRETIAGIKPKDLVGIPWLVAFALRADGWVLRSEIVWSKPNPMPESVTDRPTKAHEQIFLFSKAKWVGGGDPPAWLPAVDAAWLAALVDGEGSICFQNRQEDGRAEEWSIRLSVCNTNRALLEKASAICNVGGGPGAPSPRYRSTGETLRPIFAWQVTNRKAAAVLAAIRPYLIAKGTQADLALAVHSLNQKHKGGKGRHVTTADDAAFKARAAAACSELNRGGTPDLDWFVPIKPGRWEPLPYMYDAAAIAEESIHAGAVITNNNGKNGQMGQFGQTRGGFLKDGGVTVAATRNARSVWTIATQPYAGAHFATFPEELARRCILAGSSARACESCGAPWERVTTSTPVGPVYERGACPADHRAINGPPQRTAPGSSALSVIRQTLGWQPTCACQANTGATQGVVLDPFGGSGTVAAVATGHGRSAVHIDLNPAYIDLARQRIGPLMCEDAESVA